jgi:hypothetical protein
LTINYIFEQKNRKPQILKPGCQISSQINTLEEILNS